MRSPWLITLVVAVLLSTLLLSSPVFAQGPPPVPSVPQPSVCCGPWYPYYNVYVGYGGGYGAGYNGGWGYGYGVQTPYVNHYGYGMGYGSGSWSYGYNYTYYGWWDP